MGKSTRQSSATSSTTQPDGDQDTQMTPAPAAASSTTSTRRGSRAVKKEKQTEAKSPEPEEDDNNDDNNNDGGDDSGNDSDEQMENAALAREAQRQASLTNGSTFPTPALMQSASLIIPNSTMLQQHRQAGASGLPACSPPTNIARFSTMGPHGPQLVSPPSGVFTRQLSRLPSTSGPSNGVGGTFATNDWRVNVAVEERINIRRKLREAYFKHCPTFEQLLDTAVAIDEELLFSCSANRIDYFKSSIDWDSRIQLKRQQLKSGTNTNGGESKKRSADAMNGDLSSESVSLLEIGINNSDLLPSTSSSSTSTAASLQIPPISQLTGVPKSPSKDTASSLVSLSGASPAKKQKN